MIPTNFVYARPDTKEEAADFYALRKRDGENPLYFGAGSEIITMCRSGAIRPGVIIDIKQIPEANELALRDGQLIIGAAVALRAIRDSKFFPLLGSIAGRIADHTNQCRITLGGNLCGTIMYRETSQALLLADAIIVFYGPNGLREESIHTAFERRMRLGEGEMILQARVPAEYLNAPYNHVKKTANEKIDYPLLSISAMKVENRVRAAVSGYLPDPFRDARMEDIWNRIGLPGEARAEQILDALGPPVSDVYGGGDYRRFVMKRTLEDMMEAMDT